MANITVKTQRHYIFFVLAFTISEILAFPISDLENLSYGDAL